MRSEAGLRSRLRAWFAQRDLVLLTGALLLVALGWAFVEIADEVIEGETQDIDDRILMALRERDNPADPIGPPWLEELGRDMTALGGVLVLTTLTAAVLGFLLIQRKSHAALFSRSQPAALWSRAWSSRTASTAHAPM